MRQHLLLMTLIILLLGFFSSDSATSPLTGTAISKQSDTFTASKTFTAWRTSGHSQGSLGEGTVTFELPDKPQACDIQGTWITNNHMYASLGRQQQHCHGARGTFVGYVDRGKQLSINDPGRFRWADPTEPESDPEPYETPDKIFDVLLCDSFYHTPFKRGYSVKGFVEDFGASSTVNIRWRYFNDETYPGADIKLTLACTPQRVPQREVTKKIIQPKPAEEQPQVIPESFVLDVEDLPAPAPPVRRTFLENIAAWFRAVFF